MLIIIFPLNPFTSINKYNSFAYVNARTETRVRQLNFDRRRRTFVPCRMIRMLNRPVIRNGSRIWEYRTKRARKRTWTSLIVARGGEEACENQRNQSGASVGWRIRPRFNPGLLTSKLNFSFNNLDGRAKFAAPPNSFTRMRSRDNL